MPTKPAQQAAHNNPQKELLACLEFVVLVVMSEDSSLQNSIEALWAAHQQELRQQLITNDSTLSWKLDPDSDEKTSTSQSLRLIGGVDISFFGDGVSDAVAALVVLSYPQLKIVYETYRIVHLTHPYIVGFLAFREVPHLMELLDDLKQKFPELMPQLLLVDGNGILHQRGFGLASHLGVICNIPTIGVAKNLLYVDGLERDTVNTQCERLVLKGGDTMPLVGNSGTTWGTALRSTDDSGRHVYVSVGHRISLETATNIVYKCCLVRIPEPIRCADLGSREYIRRFKQQQHGTRTSTTTTTAGVHPIEYIRMNVASCYPPKDKGKNNDHKHNNTKHTSQHTSHINNQPAETNTAQTTATNQQR